MSCVKRSFNGRNNGRKREARALAKVRRRLSSAPVAEDAVNSRALRA